MIDKIKYYFYGALAWILSLFSGKCEDDEQDY